jgi:hypothetical protein
MAVSSSPKLCRLCHKDVSNAKRVKDAKGQYYCQECHDNAVRKPAQPVPAEVDLAPEPAPVKKLPEFCPNCGAKVFPNRKLCIKCNRDVTKMDKLIAIQKEAAKGPSSEEKVATIVGKTVKFALILFVIGFVIFCVWGIKLMFTPADPWEQYPTSRTAAVQKWLGYIAEGTPKAYDNAFLMISYRARTVSNANEETFYKFSHMKIHDEFLKKYGNGWLSKVEFEKGEFQGNEAEESIAFKIGDDVYHVETQVQIAIDQVVMNVASRQQPSYADNAKNHFGIIECFEYPAHPRPKDVPHDEPNYGGTGAPVY